MSLFTLNEYTEQKKFRPQKTVFSYKDDNDYKTKRNNLIRHNLGNTVGFKRLKSGLTSIVFDLRIKIRQIRKVTNCEVTVAIAAPAIPIEGRPK